MDQLMEILQLAEVQFLLTIAAWVVGLGITSWLVLGGIFLAYPTVQKLKDEYRDSITWRLKVPVYLWLVIGLTADVLFNWTWGTVICREFPREFLFTDRLKRHWRGDDDKMKLRIERWVTIVNMIDPGHVKFSLPPQNLMVEKPKSKWWKLVWVAVVIGAMFAYDYFVMGCTIC